MDDDAIEARARELVDEYDMETLLREVPNRVIVDAFLRQYDFVSAGGGWDGPDSWSTDVWMSAELWSDEERLRACLLLLVERAPDNALGYVGAGPLEDFIVDDEARIRWIESQAGTSARFRAALSNVWVWDSLTPEQFGRVERAARVPLARPKSGPNSAAPAP